LTVVLLIEIEGLAQNEVDRIHQEIEKLVEPWKPDYYHRRELLKPKWRADPDTPDSFFSRHAGTKPRLILRLTGKVILPKVRLLLPLAPSLVLELISTFDHFVLHEQIAGYIERWDRQEKRQRESETDQIVASKRKLTTEFSSHENLPQRGITNQAQVLPTIRSLPEPDFQYQSLPLLPTRNTNNFAHNQAFHAGYENQQNLQDSTQTVKKHQRLTLQMGEQEEDLWDNYDLYFIVQEIDRF